jgi:hypothetical protein
VLEISVTGCQGCSQYKRPPSVSDVNGWIETDGQWSFGDDEIETIILKVLLNHKYYRITGFLDFSIVRCSWE